MFNPGSSQSQARLKTGKCRHKPGSIQLKPGSNKAHVRLNPCSKPEIQAQCSLSQATTGMIQDQDLLNPSLANTGSNQGYVRLKPGIIHAQAMLRPGSSQAQTTWLNSCSKTVKSRLNQAKPGSKQPSSRLKTGSIHV